MDNRSCPWSNYVYQPICQNTANWNPSGMHIRLEQVFGIEIINVPILAANLHRHVGRETPKGKETNPF